MACSTQISKNIISNCSTATPRGIEAVAYIWNRGNVSITHDSTNPVKVTGLAKNGTGIKAYKITGFKSNLSYSNSAKTNADYPTRYSHVFVFDGYEFDASSIENFDSMDDICVVVEQKEKYDGGDGTFVGLGFECGLWKSKDETNNGANNGARKLEFSSLDTALETQSQYNVMITAAPSVSVYADTLEALESLTEA